MAAVGTVAAERRAQILDAAGRTFARGGFHGSSMQDVCKEAGLSPGSVYRYFPGKDVIIAALVERDTAESIAVIETLHEDADPLAALLGLVDRAFENLLDVRTCALNIEIEAEAARNPQVGALVRRADADLAAALAGALRRLGADRGVGAPDADGLALVLIAIIIGASAQRALDPTLELAAHARIVRELILGRFGAPTPLDARTEEGSL